MLGKATHALEAVWTPLVLMAVVTLLTVVTGGFNAQPALIDLILVVGLYIFIGNSGVFSFGHVAFMGLGAYACGLITMSVTTKSILLPNLPGFLAHAHLATTPAVVIAGAFAGAFAFVVAIPLMRLSGLAAGIATLSLLVIVSDVISNDAALTGGSGNLTGVPTDATETMILIWALVAIAVAFAYQCSRFGLRLRASREDEVAARAVGIRVERERRIAFTLSAVVTGVAGGLYGHYLGSLSPDSFYLATTFLVIAMLVVGGVHSLRGAVTGAVVLAAVSEVLDRWENGQSALGISIHTPSGTRQIVFALLVIVILIVRPEGLSAGREVPWPLRRRAAAPDPSQAEVPAPDAAQLRAG